MIMTPLLSKDDDGSGEDDECNLLEPPTPTVYKPSTQECVRQLLVLGEQPMPALLE